MTLMMAPSPLSSRLFWLLAAVVLAIPIGVWGNSMGWQLQYISPGLLFPLLGMLAFSLMWLQMASGAFPFLSPEARKGFLVWSGLAVLALIIAHPLLLNIHLFQATDQFTIANLYDYVGEDMGVYITIAILAWLIFLSYAVIARFRRWRHFNRALQAYEYLNYIGFFLIFIHSINLGGNLQANWLTAVWFFYALSALYFAYRDLTSGKFRLTEKNQGVS